MVQSRLLSIYLAMHSSLKKHNQLAVGHLTEWTLHRPRRFIKWTLYRPWALHLPTTFHRMETLHRMDISPTGHFAERRFIEWSIHRPWTLHRPRTVHRILILFF